MIKIVTGILVLSASLWALDWEKDLDSAIAKAQKEHKNMMVMVEGAHCGWCKKMKASTLTDGSIEKRLKKFVVVKVMREDSKSMAKLPPVNGVPTIFFMKENKAIIEEVVGYFNVADFTFYINNVEKKVKK